MRINEILIKEQATAGATSAGNIAAVVSPHIAIGSDRFKQSYTGTPGQSGKRAPRVPRAYTPKKADGTALGAHELTGTSLFGGPLVKR
jgi:hypothetical protein